jgi:hypothetical protein
MLLSDANFVPDGTRFNHDIQLEIDCYEWVLRKIEVNKISFDRLEGIIRAIIKDLEKRKNRAMVRTETGDSTKPQAPAGMVLKQQLDLDVLEDTNMYEVVYLQKYKHAYYICSSRCKHVKSLQK